MRTATTTIKGSLDRLLELDSELRDLSFERDDALLKLHESEHRYRALNAASYEAIIIHRGKDILAANESFEVLTGYNEEELKEATPSMEKIILPECIDDVQRRIDEKIDTPYRCKYRAKSGEILDVYVRPKYVPYNGFGLCRAAVVTMWEERKYAE